MWVNVTMAATKGALGIATHSSALIADAAHSVSDLLSDFVTLWSVKIARLPPDGKHPYGYGKFEAVGSLSVGAILVCAGLGIGVDSLHTLQDVWLSSGNIEAFPQFSLPFFPDLDRNTQLALAAGAAGASIAAKEGLYHATVRIGERAKSKVLIANAWHHRTDAISSIVAMGGIMGTMAGLPLLDPAAGMAVSAMIAKTGVDICLDSVRELTDKSVEAEVLDLLTNVTRSVDDVRHVSHVRARRMGPYTLVDLRIHIAGRVRAQVLRELPDVSEVLVHIDVMNTQQERARLSSKHVYETAMRPYNEIRRDVSIALAGIAEIIEITHVNTHWMQYLNGNGTQVDVTISVQSDLRVGDAHTVAKKARRVMEAIPYICEADIHLELLDSEHPSSASVDASKPRGFLMDFFLAGIATGGACIGSNPMEVVKTRMQLQGELARNVAEGGAPTVRYRNFAHGFFTICRTEGLYGIQRGLLPGMAYQTFMNAPRLGLFEPLQKVYGATDPTCYTYPLRNIAAAMTSGIIGAWIGSPFFLVKARIQAASSTAKINAQYHYNGMMDGFRQILKSEGFFGLYRGMSGALPRVAVGSGAQLSSYAQSKSMVMATGIEDGFQVQLGASLVSGLAVTTAMNPFDVVSTRLYSQKVVNGKGELYDNVFDCIRKTFRAEGIRGFYKGWTAHYFRLGPHTMFTFLLWEKAKKVASDHGY
ncbi:TPA: hypothetical protein N0F65_004120 [Lagenidium giganteum]|uniref:Cation efflux protein transmembrane domain-containing protein n=1 Tax=Lagenidium giganteum TaxID=4803 RepID=A0AAV2Z8F7_9STRA|nr:TPA: hypothetical protein N0F65_004120 [Lagenidium giganteum]